MRVESTCMTGEMPINVARFICSGLAMPFGTQCKSVSELKHNSCDGCGARNFSYKNGFLVCNYCKNTYTTGGGGKNINEGEIGEMTFDDKYVYVCELENQWKRVALNEDYR